MGMDTVERDNGDVTVPADLVEDVALGLRVALRKLRQDAQATYDMIGTDDWQASPRLIRTGMESAADATAELHANLVRSFRALPAELRPPALYMEPPQRR